MKKTLRKAPFRGGQDHKQGSIRKMILNFFKNGTLSTTSAKARYIKAVLDRLVFKASVRSEANKNVLLKYLANDEVIEYLFDHVADVNKGKTSGYVSMKKTIVQKGDNASITKISWVMTVEPFTTYSKNKKLAKKPVVKKETSVKKVSTKKAIKAKV
ncbi:MAG: L17 family ribosomal protein [Candidatus Roizmanbacteria bacterium]